jgi:hypothetical protein
MRSRAIHPSVAVSASGATRALTDSKPTYSVRWAERLLLPPNIKTDAMFPAKAFDALIALVAEAAAKHVVDGQPERLYEPLDHLEPGLARTLIHVSGSEVLLHDASCVLGPD